MLSQIIFTAAFANGVLSTLLHGIYFDNHEIGDATHLSLPNAQPGEITSMQEAQVDCATRAIRANVTTYQATLFQNPQNPGLGPTYRCYFAWNQDGDNDIVSSLHKSAICRGECNTVDEYTVTDHATLSMNAGAHRIFALSNIDSMEDCVSHSIRYAHKKSFPEYRPYHKEIALIWASTGLDTKCEGYVLPPDARLIYLTHVAVGAIAPLNAQAGGAPRNMSCTEHDIVEDLSPECKQFTVETPYQPVETEQYKRMPSLPQSERFFWTYPDSEETLSLRYTHLATSRDSTYAEVAPSRLEPGIDHFYAFTPQKAFHRCGEIAMDKYFRTFNLVYRRTGYTCTTYYNQTIPGTEKLIADDEVVYSWLYSGDLSKHD